MNTDKKKLLMCNWKDIKHPLAGGAELVTHELLKRLIEDNFEVTLLTALYENSSKFDEIDGVNIIRVGRGKVTHTFLALWYYLTNLRGKFDFVIDEVNTAPYFTTLFTKKSERPFIFYHQLARKVWFYEFGNVFGALGYFILEPFSLILQAIFARYKKAKIITVSESSKNDLARFGFKKDDIKIITEGIKNTPLVEFNPANKEDNFTVLFHSSLRQMKRPEDCLKAFEIFIQKISKKEDNLDNKIKLWISGGGDKEKYEKLASELNIAKFTNFYGRTSEEEKLELMKKASVLCSTSIKEGWGLVVTEANSMGTPAIVYDVDGLRDSAKQGGGIISKPDPESLAIEILKMYELFIQNREEYNKMCEFSLAKSKEINFENSYIDFKKIIFENS